MEAKNSEVFKFFYLEMTDRLSDYLSSGLLEFKQNLSQYVLVADSVEIFKEDYRYTLESISVQAGLRYKQNPEDFTKFEEFLKRSIDPETSYFINILHMALFNPYVMSPVVMMFMVSRIAMIEFIDPESRSLDDIFDKNLDFYNSLLDNPISHEIIDSMKLKFKHDDLLIKTNTAKWFTSIRHLKTNAGFIWLNNSDFDCFNDFDRKVELMQHLGKYSFRNARNISAMYLSLKQKLPLRTNSSLRYHLLGLYLTTFAELNAKNNLNFYGVGLVQLMLQGIATSVSVMGDEVLFKNILISGYFYGDFADRENFLDVVDDHVLYSGSPSLNNERMLSIANHNLILDVISGNKTPSNAV